MIEISNLYYDYPGLRALNDVSFQLPECSITALVGPNGAGKTTLLRSIAALDIPTSGKITIHGIDVLENPREAHLHMGYLPDHFGLYQELSALQCLTYAAWSRGLRGDEVTKAVHWAVEQVQLEAQLTKLAATLSRGQRQRLALAQAIVHRPKVVLMDEPASGLDPQARASLAELMKNLATQGMTLLISSHILAELEAYCTDMLVLEHGEILAHQAIDGSRRSSGVSEHEMQARQIYTSHKSVQLRIRLASSQSVSDFAQWLIQQGFTTQVRGQEEVYLQLNINDDAEQAQCLLQFLQAGWLVKEFAPLQKSMQDIYFQAIEQKEYSQNTENTQKAGA